MMKQNESGRTLLEMLGVLAIIGIITVGAMSGLKFGTDSLRATALHEMVESTAQGVAELYSWSREYPSEENSGKVASLGELVPDNGVCNAYECGRDGDDVIAVTTYGNMRVSAGEDGTYFVITLTDIPKEVCMRLAATTWSENVEWESSKECANETQDIEFYAH